MALTIIDLMGARVGSERLLPPLVPAAVHTSESFHVSQGKMFPAEQILVAGASHKRKAEFSTVRGCARNALSLLDIPPAPILRGPGGAPVWPEGIVGSMTHCRNYCAAAVASASAITAIGIDAEPAQQLPAGVLNLVAGGAEQEAITSLALANPTIHWDRLLFCVKEAVYKAWYPLTGLWIGFLEAVAELHTDGRFTVHIISAKDFDLDMTFWEGTWIQSEGLLVAASVRLPAPS
ncbi:4'-phosphopantetheinyl transferase superfamily protein [Arthrobacter sp. H5]|uniref:4'-phosphopantetheinyl transferase family protein n=1 Tax=Arthrobacter sp. H5 TaxID=1267973 RepID=UPI0004BA2152|nr:4'-phosphopantetheinyl transferase superfamily protein [Arthrobacter sp. H5]